MAKYSCSGAVFSLLSIFFAIANVQYCEANVERTKIVQLKHGKVNGFVDTLDDGKKVEFFQGIRYGKAERFGKPKPVAPWPEVYDAISYRAACPQFGFDIGKASAPIDQTTTYDEDCLFLNVWRPVNTSQTSRLPVMVWIHGGAFEIGTIFTSMYDGSDLAIRGNLIVVSLNYRLGVLGFAYGGGIPANLGLHDQIFGLRWVRENIANFGGDPTQVTVFGESAGSMSVGALILSPLATGLFSRAIMQSGAPTSELTTSKLSRVAQLTHIMARNLNCSNFETDLESAVKCMRTKTVAELKKASLSDFPKNLFFRPAYGDEVLPIRPARALIEGKFNRNIDLIFGVTRDEGTLFLPLYAPEVIFQELTVESSKQIVRKLSSIAEMPILADEVADYYISKLPKNASSDALKVMLGAIFGDINLVCPTILFAEQLAKTASADHNRYYSYRLMQLGIQFPGFPVLSWSGVTHGQDLAYIFPRPYLDEFTKPLQQLSDDMLNAWISFAKTGNPGKMGSIQWQEAFSGGNKSDAYATRFMHLEAGHYKVVDNFYQGLCHNFWKPKIFD